MKSLRFLPVALIVLSVGVTGLLRAGSSAPAAASTSADEALKRLLEGNGRFVAGTPSHPNQSVDRRAALTGGQTPFAVILTCADSRVAPEIYFDQGLGDLFVLRNAGNVLNDHIVGSIEYAVEHLHTKLIVVVGHSQCGAVAATVAGGHASGHIHSIVESIEPSLAIARKQQGDAVDNTVRVHARRVAEILSQVDPIVGAAVKAGQVKAAAGRYDLATGRIEILN